MSVATPEPGSVFSRCPRAWRVLLTVGACHAILGVGGSQAPGMLAHLRTSFLHEGGYDWAATYSFLILWSLIALVYFQGLRLLSGSTRLALLWTGAGGGCLVVASAVTLILPRVADFPLVSNLFFALFMTVFVQSALEARWARGARS